MVSVLQFALMFGSKKRAAKKAAKQAELADKTNYSYKVWFDSYSADHPFKTTVFFKNKSFSTTFHRSKFDAEDWAKTCICRSIAKVTGPQLLIDSKESMPFVRKETQDISTEFQDKTLIPGLGRVKNYSLGSYPQVDQSGYPYEQLYF